MTDNSDNGREEGRYQQKESCRPAHKPMPEPPTEFDTCVEVEDHDNLRTSQYIARLKESGVWVRYTVAIGGETNIEAIGRISIMSGSKSTRDSLEPYVQEAVEKEQQRQDSDQERGLDVNAWCAGKSDNHTGYPK